MEGTVRAEHRPCWSNGENHRQLTGLLHLSSISAQMVENLPAMQETQVQSLGWEDPLEKGMATHSNTLAWRIPWTEEPAGLPSMELQGIGYN